ncbi:MAG TPA: hypothetical protein VIL74_19305 [Pyrinomonadaceae bacterium]|jgi:hypothetical protein
MNEKTVVITEMDGKYRVENNGISEFALLGILECIVFDLKSAKRAATEINSEIKTANAPAPVVESTPVKTKESAAESNSPELRTRIANAIKAIRGLGGQTPDFDADSASDQELQEELNALTEQYKRLKGAKSPGK